jgi:hypothetical protein
MRFGRLGFAVQFSSDFLLLGTDRPGIAISRISGMTVPDLARTGGNVTSGVGTDQATCFMDWAIQSRALLESGLRTRTEGSAERHVFAAFGRA